MLNRLRRRLDGAIIRRVDARLEQRLKETARAQQDYEARLAGNQADFSYMRSEFDRIAPQLAALEQRFEQLRAGLDVAELPESDRLAQAQVEHERSRIRLELVAHYEERLRRLESGDA